MTPDRCDRCPAPGYGFRGREWLCEGCAFTPRTRGTGIIYAWAAGATLVLVLATIGSLIP